MSARPATRWRALAALLRDDRSRWIALGLLIALSTALSLAGPLVVRRVVDEAADGTTTERVVQLAVVFLAIAVGVQIVSVVVASYATTAAWRTTNELRMRMTGHVIGLDHEFHRRHTPGELIQRVDGDVTSVSDFLGRVVPKAVGAALLVIGMILVLAFIDWRVALGMALYVAFAGWVVVASRHRAVQEASDEMGSYAQLYGGIEERLTAAEDLRANGASTHAMWRFVGDSAGALRSSVRRENAFMKMWWAVQGAVAAGSVASLVVGAVLVTNGVITIGTAFLLFQYVLLISRPLEDLVQQLETVQKANGAMVRVLDLLEVEPSIVDRGTTSPPVGPLSVELDHVSFDYGDGRNVIRDVDLRVAAGRSIGIVGRTGSGKTTASRLVLRLIEATDGAVRLGGVPIADIPVSELRRRVTSIPQEVELFAGSVRDNVTLFDPAPSDAAVEEALRRVGLDALVASGIHRQLGAGGAGLSAGEGQLVALARVWLRQPDLIVLDEATARVDPVTEARIETAVAELMRGRTSLVIAHRLSTLAKVDEIAVFDHGRVVEHDDRAELVARHGSRFRELLELALEADRDEAVATAGDHRAVDELVEVAHPDMPVWEVPV